MTIQTPDKDLAQRPKTLRQMLADVNVKARFEEIMGQKAAGFISSIISEINSKKDLEECEPGSVIAAAAIAASLDLPILGTLGFSALVPYNDKKSGKKVAQFQIMKNGWIQLAQRTDKYKHMNAAEVREGQLISANELTGAFVFDAKAKKSEKVIGYLFYFQLTNGFEKYTYMTVAECEAWGKKYSKSYASEYGKWKLDFQAMALKTVIKRGFRWGPVAIESPLAKAYAFDQAAVTQDGNPDYIDATTIPENAEGEPKKLEPPKRASEVKKAETKTVSFQPLRAAKADISGEIVWVITDMNQNKYLLNDDEAGTNLAEMIVEAAKQGATIQAQVEKRDRRDWLLAVQL